MAVIWIVFLPGAVGLYSGLLYCLAWATVEAPSDWFLTGFGLAGAETAVAWWLTRHGVIEWTA